MIKILSVLLVLTATELIYSQNKVPVNYFRPPINIPIILAGNFAELRPNHFHGGIDIKTENKEGMKVYAVADGYVSRVKVSTYGYGRAVYITHPNGYVSVYAHLSSFYDNLGLYVKKQQYAQKIFEVDLSLKPTEFEVKQGDVIALSGNTGHSSGPHLHFEIREELSEKTLNPLAFGFIVNDKVKPQITRLKIYPFDDNALINNKNKAIEYAVNNNHFGNKNDTLEISGKVYFGIEGYDTETIRGGKNGFYSVELQVNGLRKYYHEMNVVGFDETRCLNSLIDYPTFKKTKKLIQRTYVEPNNSLCIYKDVVDNGVLSFNKDGVHEVKYIAKDFFGNATELAFPVKSKDRILSNSNIVATQNSTTVFQCNAKNEYVKEGIEISMPKNTLYNDIAFTCSIVKIRLPSSYSDIYQVHTSDIPVHDFFTISIKPKVVDDSLKKHLVITRVNDRGEKEFVGGRFENGFVVAQVKEFGNYVVTIDTVKPQLVSVKKTSKRIEFIVKDNFSGIKNYNAYIDDNWVLLEYEHKLNKLYYTFDTSQDFSPFSQGNLHLLKLYVSDAAENVLLYSTPVF